MSGDLQCLGINLRSDRIVLGEMNPGERIDDYFHTPGKSVLEVVYPKGMMVC